MFYVTENELRGAYNREHFSSYTLPEDAKLTPSARQFLIDFHIDFNEGYGAMQTPLCTILPPLRPALRMPWHRFTTISPF